MKFAFLGYDIFVEVCQTLIDNGWDFSHYCATLQDEKYNSRRQIEMLGQKYRSVNIGDRLNENNIDRLKQDKVDVVISAGYGFRIPNQLLGSITCINVHPTILPKGRGPWPLPYLVTKHKDASGVTFHLMEEEFDAGDILLQEKIYLDDSETLESLTFKAKLTAAHLAGVLANDFQKIIAHATSQNSAGEYWPMPDWDRDRTLDWNLPIREIENRVRSFGKFATGATFDGKDWIVFDCVVWEAKHSSKPGRVVSRGIGEVLIAGVDGFVLLTSYEIDPDWSEFDA